MDYEKKYNEALERASKLRVQNPFDTVSQMMEHVFPELADSEDERIRKGLIEYFKDFRLGTFAYLEPKKIIAWLEKQGTPAKLSEEEQNRFAKGVLSSCALSFIDYLDAHKYEGKMCVSNGECEDIENAFHNAMWDRLHRYYCKYIEKQGEQKPWSEEVEAAISLLKHIAEEQEKDYCPHNANDLRKAAQYLETCRPQSTWKPSEEHIHGLIWVINRMPDIKNANEAEAVLRDLLEQLNKLRKG